MTYNCSETLTGTWLALQNVKQRVLKFNLGTQYVYPHKRASFIRLLNSRFFSPVKCGLRVSHRRSAASYPGQFALSELPEEAWKRVQ